MSSFIFGSCEDAVLLDDFPQPDQLGFDLAFSSDCARVNQFAQFDDFLAQRRRIVGSHEVFQFGNDFLLLFFGQIVEVVGQALVDLLLTVAFGVGEDRFALFLHALKAAADGVDARREAALEHRHGERECATAWRIFRGGLDGLVFDEAGQGIVEIQFVVVDLETRWCGRALGEQRLDLAGFRVGKETSASLTRRK